jgi:hypothetical protein
MANLLEYVGCVHIYLGPYRGNPIALYLNRTGSSCQIGPKAYPWNDVTGVGETPNKAAADFEDKWKPKGWRQRCIQALPGKAGLSRRSPRRLNRLRLPSQPSRRLHLASLRFLHLQRQPPRWLLPQPQQFLFRQPPRLLLLSHPLKRSSRFLADRYL